MTGIFPSTARQALNLILALLLAVGGLHAGVPASPTSCVDSQSRAVVTGGTNGLRAVHAVDFDEDGDLDLLSASSNDDKIILWRNEAPLDEYTEILVSKQADGAVAVASGDIDGDGDLDVISASSNDDKIAWYEASDSQLFIERVISLDADVATDLYVVDMDDDGDLDVLASSFNDDTIRLFRSDLNPPPPDSTCDCDTTPSKDCDPSTFCRIPNFKEFVVTADLDADGATSVYAAQLMTTPGDERLEIISASRFDQRITWYEEIPFLDDKVTPPEEKSNFIPHVVDTGASGVSSVVAADIDGDTFIDLASSSTDGRIDWFRNNQTDQEDPPTFTKMLVHVDAASVAQVIALDVDQDGDQDLVASSPTTGSVNWFENIDGNGDFDDQLTNAAPIGVGIAGANGLFAVEPPTMMDQVQIFVAASVSGAIAGMDRLERFQSDGGMPPSWSAATVGQASVAPVAMIVVDIEEQEMVGGDGDMDVIIASAVDNNLLLFRNDGLMPPSFTRETISDDAPGGSHLAWGDLDGDGLRDLVAALTNDDAIAWYRNMGDGMFGDPTTNRINLSSFAAVRPSSVAIADLDGDGDNDVISTSSEDDKVAWYANLRVPDAPAMVEDLFGDPFGNEILLTSEALGAEQAIAVDLNADGCEEIVAVSSEDSAVRWFPNPPAGGGACDGPSADDVQLIDAGFAGARGLAAGDLDKDGDPDLVIAAATADALIVVDNGFINADPESLSGDPVDFTSVRTVGIGIDFIREVALANMDGTDDAGRDDNPLFAADVDIVAIGSGRDQVSWFESSLNSIPEAPLRCSSTTLSCEISMIINTCGVCSESEESCTDSGDCPVGESCDARCTFDNVDCTDNGDADCVLPTDDCELLPNLCEIDSICSISGTPCDTDDDAESCEFADDVCAGTCSDDMLTTCTMDSECTDPATCEFRCADTDAACTEDSDCTDSCVPTTDPETNSCSLSGDRCDPKMNPTDCPRFNVCEPGILRQSYNERPLTDQAESVRSLAVADIDNDGVLDIITGSFFEVLWHAGGASEACLCFDVVGTGSTVDRPDYCRAMTVEAGDREIDGGELSLLGAAFNGSCAAPFGDWECGADFNGDGKIDGDDLAILSSFGVWGAVVAPDLDPDSTEVKDACSFTCP